jgi:hypothetical protein
MQSSNRCYSAEMTDKDVGLEIDLQNKARDAPDEFPGDNGDDFLIRYKRLRTEFQTEYQNYIDAALALKEGILFTRHGKEHFKTVIAKAHEVIQADSQPLTGYEIYVLLVAIHLHDIGNLFGRVQHERACLKIIEQLGSILSNDSVEKRIFYDVARVHGGKILDNKDTIRTLKTETIFKEKHVRPRKLAAILRLADELADDYSRVSGALVKFKIMDSVYHYYAQGLHSVEVRARDSRVDLHFFFEKSLLTRKLKKNKTRDTWLITEVMDRTLKTFLEMKYCSQYMRTINFDSLNVSIEWATEGNYTETDHMIYSFDSLGFPTIKKRAIYVLAPALNSYGKIGKVRGANLRKYLTQAPIKAPRNSSKAVSRLTKRPQRSGVKTR